MDQFIVLSDFDTLIDSKNLDEVIDEIPAILEKSIPDAIEEAACHIRHRYDEDKVFAVVNTFATGTIYSVDDRIIWSPAAYVEASSYDTDAIVSYSGNIYQAKEDTITGVWDPAKWTLITTNNSLYFCIKVTTGTELPNNTTYFTAGDSRNTKLVQVTVDIALYNLHSRLSPRNIPELRRIRYDGNGDKKGSECAISWLEKVANGKITPDLQVIVDDDGNEPENSQRVSHGISPTANYKY